MMHCVLGWWYQEANRVLDWQRLYYPWYRRSLLLRVPKLNQSGVFDGISTNWSHADSTMHTVFFFSPQINLTMQCQFRDTFGLNATLPVLHHTQITISGIAALISFFNWCIPPSAAFDTLKTVWRTRKRGDILNFSGQIRWNPLSLSVTLLPSGHIIHVVPNSGHTEETLFLLYIYPSHQYRWADRN